MSIDIKNIIWWIDEQYTYLHTVLYLDHYLRENEVKHDENEPWFIKFDDNKSYLLRNNHIRKGIEIAKIKQFWLIWDYAVIGACRSIFSFMYEWLQDPHFKAFVEEFLDKSFADFDLLMRFIRHIFSHNISRDFILNKKDFEEMRDYLIRKKIPTSLHFIRKLGPYPVGPQYREIDIAIDFWVLRSWGFFWETVTSYNCLLIIELCYEICIEYCNKRGNPFVNL